MKQFSRRSALFSAAIIPAVALSRHSQTAEGDPVLLALGRQFDVVAMRLDHGDTAWETINDLSRIYDEIVATPATTMQGLFVKARVECWGLLGDLDAGQSNMAVSRPHPIARPKPGAAGCIKKTGKGNRGERRPTREAKAGLI